MKKHPLPALPAEDQVDVRIEPRCGNPRLHDLRKAIEVYTLFDDASEVGFSYFNEPNCPGAFQYTSAVPDDLLLSQRPFTPKSFARYTEEDSIVSATLAETNTAPWSPYDDIGPRSLLRHLSSDAVCDYIPDTFFDQTTTFHPSEAEDDSLHELFVNLGDEPCREPLVRFADAHTIIHAPYPPTPPPHQSVAIFTPWRRRPQPCGPRNPPWGSAENLNHERRSRNDIRVLADTLNARLEKRERLRKEAVARNETRRTEGEELRELVRGIYPELGSERKERGCMCVVM